MEHGSWAILAEHLCERRSVGDVDLFGGQATVVTSVGNEGKIRGISQDVDVDDVVFIVLNQMPNNRRADY